MTYLIFSFYILFNGIVFSIFGVVIERLLVKDGLTRGNTIGVVVGCFTIALVRQITGSEQVHWLFWLAACILVPVSMNRSDLIATLTKGRWWWKLENNIKDH
jgi:uncharacterized membrane-anchored protein